MDKLKALYEKCSNVGQVVELYIQTKHNLGSFDYAKFYLLKLGNTTDEDNFTSLPYGNNPQDWYTLNDVRTIHTKKFGLWGSDLELLVRPMEVKGIKNVLPILLRLFDHIFHKITEAAGDNDLLRIVFQSTQLTRPIALRTSRKEDLNAEIFFDTCVKVLQSNEDFTLEHPILINITRVEALPQIGGRIKGGARHEILLAKHLQNKRTIVSIRDDKDGLCLARSIVVGLAICQGAADRADQREWKAISRSDRRKTPQYYEALLLHEQVGLRPGPVSLDQVEQFQAYLSDYQITVYGSDNHNDIIYSGPARAKQINLLQHNNHYSVIRRVVPFVRKRIQCQYCKKLYDRVDSRHHRCLNLCYVCQREKGQCLREEVLHCALCNRNFGNKVCFEAHQNTVYKDIPPICTTHFNCKDCGNHVNRLARRLATHHICHERFCRNCQALVEPEHQCYIKKYNKLPKPCAKFIYADFECDISTTDHIPVCAVAMYDDGTAFKFFGAETGNDFCAWLFNRRHRNHIILFHNMSGYDGNFLLQFLQTNKIKPCVTMKGLKIIQIDVKQFKICVRDTLCHLPFKLANMPKAFGIPELKKGTFPFLFTRPEHYEYKGCIPNIQYFFTSAYNEQEKTELQNWLTERKDDVWDFRQEMLAYCAEDVNILRQVCQKYSSNMREITGFCPLTESTTLAGFVNLLYRATFMPENSIALLPEKSFGAGRNVSLESMEWLYYISHKFPDMDIRHAKNHIDGEKRIGRYRVDGYDEQSRTVFEYQGCYYHGHPECMAPDAKNLNGVFMRDLYEECVSRKNHLVSMGYQYHEIWGCEWKSFKTTDTHCQEILANMPYSQTLDPRAALRGGRSEAFRLICIPQSDEHVAYKDCISMYPSVLRNSVFPIGHPQIITRNFLSLDKYFGVASVKILPPSQLRVPLLPVFLNKKMYFTLCRTCAEKNQKAACHHSIEERCLQVTLPIVELLKALQIGYTIQEIYEIWHYPQSSSELFRSYIDCFRGLKLKNSKNCQTPEEREEYVALLKSKGVMARPEEIQDNSVMRLLAKLLMNCLYGRFALRQNLPKFEYVTDVNRFQLLMFSNKFEVDYINVLDEKTVQVQYHHQDEFEVSDLNSNVIIAAFCTAYGRLILYENMQHLEPERLLYCDTDSIFYLESSKYSKTIPVGVDFGEFKDELEGGKITAFFCAGSKSYAYRTDRGEEVFKAKGLTINSSNRDVFSLSAIEEMIRDPEIVRVVCNPMKIFRTKGTWDVYSKEQNKIFRFVFDKRILHDDFTTSPYGYRDG